MTNPVKKHYTMTIKDFYREYRKAGGQLEYKLYRKIVEKFFLEISRKIIYENMIFMMPYSLGSVFVKSRKTNYKNARIDWGKTREQGKIVKCLNNHTYGYYFGITWDKSYVRFRNNSMYSFCATSSKKATRLGIGKKGLSQHIMKLSKDPTKRSYIRI